MKCPRGQHDAADLIVFLLYTGCRLGEALSLQWTQVGQGRVTKVKEAERLVREYEMAAPGTTSALVHVGRLGEHRAYQVAYETALAALEPPTDG